MLSLGLGVALDLVGLVSAILGKVLGLVGGLL